MADSVARKVIPQHFKLCSDPEFHFSWGDFNSSDVRSAAAGNIHNSGGLGLKKRNSCCRTGGLLELLKELAVPVTREQQLIR